MKIFTSLFFLVSLAGSAWAGAWGIPAAAPGPEMTTGLIGMTLAAGAIYLIKRRKRS
jgi:LPXTG-motif cell wall-anchored protein